MLEAESGLNKDYRYKMDAESKEKAKL